jgi:hypothetical protein
LSAKIERLRKQVSKGSSSNSIEKVEVDVDAGDLVQYHPPPKTEASGGERWNLQ